MGGTKVLNRRNYVKKYKCELCDFRADSKSRVDQHMRFHSDVPPFLCSFPGCTVGSKYPHNLEQHELRHDPELSTRYKCPMCPKGFPFPYQLERHVRSHVKEKLYECSECDFKSIFRSGLRNHTERRHGNGNQKFGKATSSSNEETEYIPTAHKSIKNEDGSTIYKCLFPRCSYQTKFSANIYKHKNRHKPSNERTLLKCTAVGCTFETKWRCVHTQHLKIHDPHRRKNYDCPLCPKKFWTAMGLKRHTSTHTGEKNYKCQHCEYATAESGNLCYHRRKYHPKLLNSPAGISLEQRPAIEESHSKIQVLSSLARNVPIVTLNRLVILKK